MSVPNESARWILQISLVIGLPVCVAAMASIFMERSEQPADQMPRITRVQLDKSDRALKLLDGERVVRTYPVALGFSPSWHKQQEGDGRTPEGNYVLDWRNAKSGYYRSIHVSYPNEADRSAAQARRVDPGGNIMIHGQPNGFGALSPFLQMRDWTHGCIAVTNEHMAEIWEMVENGTPIEINP